MVHGREDVISVEADHVVGGRIDFDGIRIEGVGIALAEDSQGRCWRLGAFGVRCYSSSRLLRISRLDLSRFWRRLG